MPGRGCLARKALRRAERDRQLAEESGLPVAKVARTGDDGQLVQVEKTWVEVPPMEELSEPDRKKAVQLCRALYEATQEYNDTKVTVSQLGSHFKVATLKKESCFANQRLVDILQRHSDVFELIAETPNVTGGWVVRLRPEAEEMLPGRLSEERLGADQEDFGLPERIEEPTSIDQNLQAIRIEVIYALHKRGLRVMLHDLGQEPRILKHKSSFLAGRKLLELIKVFPMNFSVEDKGNGNFMVELVSLDVDDTTMIFDFLERASQAPPPTETKGKGKGKGKAKGKMMEMMAMMMGKMGPKGMKGMMAKGMMAAMAGKASGRGWQTDTQAEGKGKGGPASFWEDAWGFGGCSDGWGWDMGFGADDWSEQGVCSLHGKSRSAECLRDDGAGGWRCAPGFECKMGGASVNGGTGGLPRAWRCDEWRSDDGNRQQQHSGGPILPWKHAVTSWDD